MRGWLTAGLVAATIGCHSKKPAPYEFYKLVDPDSAKSAVYSVTHNPDLSLAKLNFVRDRRRYYGYSLASDVSDFDVWTACNRIAHAREGKVYRDSSYALHIDHGRRILRELGIGGENGAQTLVGIDLCIYHAGLRGETMISDNILRSLEAGYVLPFGMRLPTRTPADTLSQQPIIVQKP
jgi:hypothetical protein